MAWCHDVFHRCLECVAGVTALGSAAIAMAEAKAALQDRLALAAAAAEAKLLVHVASRA